MVGKGDIKCSSIKCSKVTKTVSLEATAKANRCDRGLDGTRTVVTTWLIVSILRMSESYTNSVRPSPLAAAAQYSGTDHDSAAGRLVQGQVDHTLMIGHRVAAAEGDFAEMAARFEALASTREEVEARLRTQRLSDDQATGLRDASAFYIGLTAYTECVALLLARVGDASRAPSPQLGGTSEQPSVVHALVVFCQLTSGKGPRPLLSPRIVNRKRTVGFALPPV